MKRFALLCSLVVLFAGVAAAQDEKPKVEAFGGYSLIHNGSDFAGSGINFNGGGASLSYNPNSWLGFVGDFAGSHWSTTGVSVNVFTYLFGPKFTYRTGKVTPFAQALFGGAHISGNPVPCGGATTAIHQETLCSTSGSENSFAMTLGGGLDYNLTRHVGIRPVQVEYLMTRFNTGGGFIQTQNSLRYEAGVVFRW